jgi:hypothetical protein
VLDEPGSVSSGQPSNPVASKAISHSFQFFMCLPWEVARTSRSPGESNDGRSKTDTAAPKF